MNQLLPPEPSRANAIDANDSGRGDTPAVEHPLTERHIGGTEVHYYVLCPRKLWWFSHGIEQEHSGGASGPSAGQENVDLGTHLHDTRYPDKAATRKDILIDDLLRIDFTDGGIVHEIKKSPGGPQAQRATRAQIRYYLYYLKHVKGIQTTGMIDYPTERRREPITLTEGDESEIERILSGIEAIRAQPIPPAVAAPMTICKKCAYQDLCWG